MTWSITETPRGQQAKHIYIYTQIKNVLSFVALTPDVGGQSSAARGRHYRYPLNRRLGGPENRARHWVGDKTLLPLLVMKPQTISLVTAPTHVIVFT